MSPLQDEAYTYDPRPDYPFLLCVKRYTHRDLSADSSDPTAITLLLTHSVGLHKEQWEPVLQDLFGLLGTANSIGVGGTKLKIREIWAIDLPDCGESGRMNEMTFGKGTHERHPVCKSTTIVLSMSCAEGILSSYILRFRFVQVTPDVMLSSCIDQV